MASDDHLGALAMKDIIDAVRLLNTDMRADVEELLDKAEAWVGKIDQPHGVAKEETTD